MFVFIRAARREPADKRSYNYLRHDLYCVTKLAPGALINQRGNPMRGFTFAMRTIVTLLFAACVTSPIAYAQEIIYVNSGATPPGPMCDDVRPNLQSVPCREAINEAITGIACWDNAYIDLQDALDEAAALADQGSPYEIGVEIWVASGTYKPDRGTGDRFMSFSLHKNVAIYGGFAGWETYRDQRDFVNNETILSGDLNDDDDPSGDYLGGASNCCTARDTPGCDDPVCEAIICPEGTPREPVCCTRKWDFACVRKAAQSCCNLCSTRSDCDNTLNVVTALNTDSTAIIDGLTITSGRADVFPQSLGGGMHIEDGGATLRNCVFRSNVAISATAVYASDSNVIVQHSTITRNSQFPGKSAATFISQFSGSITVEDSVFSHNDSSGLSIGVDQGTVRRTTFLENKGVGAIVAFLTRATFDECRFIRNVNTFSISSGGINNRGFVTIRNSEFIGNVSGIAGAAMDNNGIAVLYNCLFLGNRSNSGIFKNGFGGSAYLEHCTFVNNERGGVDVRAGFVELKHCILWNNRIPGLIAGETSLAAQLHVDALDGAARVSYTALQNYDGPNGTFPGLGNTGADPMFVDMDGPDDIPGNEDDDLRLRPDSPLIDAGDPNASLAIDRDLDGHTRLLCDRVDMGPYEFGIGDIDCNGLVNLSDLADWPTCMTAPNDTSTTAPCTAFDFNADGAVDLSDYAALQAIISGQ